MNDFSSAPGDTVWPWLLDRNLVYAITAQKRVPLEAYPQGFETTELVTLTVTELAQLTGASARDVLSLVQCEVLEPLNVRAEPMEFDASIIPVLRRAQRMREDLALDTDEFILAVFLLVTIDKIGAEGRFADLPRIDILEKDDGKDIHLGRASVVPQRRPFVHDGDGSQAWRP
jgi:hypothetical protein